jgi:hypothetical protein
MVSFSIEDYAYHTLAAKASGELCLKHIFSFGAFTRMPLLHRSGDPNHFKVFLKFVGELACAFIKLLALFVCYEVL